MKLYKCGLPENKWCVKFHSKKTKELVDYDTNKKITMTVGVLCKHTPRTCRVVKEGG